MKFSCLWMFIFAAPGLWAADYVVIVSVDGLRPQAVEELGPNSTPNFHRLMNEGVYTHNARTDYDWTWTVPNHTCMVTARPTVGVGGHNYTSNENPAISDNYHTNKGSYITSMYDVAHDRGMTTGLFVAKNKLVIIDQSYNATHGAPDITGIDNGRDKIDQYVHNGDLTSDEITSVFTQAMTLSPMNLAMLHVRDPDTQGHGDRWETAAYSNAVVAVDGYIGSVLSLLEGTPPFVNNSTVIVTSDHGGAGLFHEDETDYGNYRIPFYVWGYDVSEPGDLYSINFYSRQEPGLSRPRYDQVVPPIRNGDVANLALMLLGLPPVPDQGAIINQQQDLKVSLQADHVGPLIIYQKMSGRGLELFWGHVPQPQRYTLQGRMTFEGFWNNVSGAVTTRRPYHVIPFDQVRGYYRVALTP